jgi:hypothetical protein
VTCGTAYAQVARGGSRGGRVGRGGRPYGLSEEATQNSDDAIIASSLSADMQLVDKRKRERPISIETFPAMVALHTSIRRLPILPADAKSIHSPPCLQTLLKTLEVHNSTQWPLLNNKSNCRLCLMSTLPCRMVHLSALPKFDTRISTDDSL